jgi:hypothetical protein
MRPRPNVTSYTLAQNLQIMSLPRTTQDASSRLENLYLVIAALSTAYGASVVVERYCQVNKDSGFTTFWALVNIGSCYSNNTCAFVPNNWTQHPGHAHNVRWLLLSGLPTKHISAESHRDVLAGHVTMTELGGVAVQSRSSRTSKTGRTMAPVPRIGSNEQHIDMIEEGLVIRKVSFQPYRVQQIR